jgi:hypothetical protein
MTQLEDTFRLMALCARAEGQPIQYQRLRQQAARLTDWDAIPARAERHGLSPLLDTHLQAAHVAIPASVKEQLQARTMQHKHANRVRARVLAEILTAFQAAGIEILVLKGAALAYVLYPEPGLRSMHDVDVLVSRSQARQAQALLAELGFNALSPGDVLPPKHLPTAQRRVEGLPVSIEIHHNLYPDGTPATELEALRPAAIPFTLEGMTAYTLGCEDMLEHVYRHTLEGAVFQPIRLISIADLVSLAERFAAEIDWPHVNPRVRNALALCHWLIPLSEDLRRGAALNPGRPPQGIGRDFQGWPRSSLAAQRIKGYGGIMRDSFFPPEWWLRFYYGLPSGPALWWGRLVRHPLHILGWVAHYYRHRTGN